MATKKPKRTKHVPQRTCVGCRAVLPKRNLIRIVRGQEGVVIDPSGKHPGRGAYLHDMTVCWEKGLKGSLAAALKTKLTEQEIDGFKRFMTTLRDSSEAAVQETTNSKTNKEARMD